MKKKTYSAVNLIRNEIIRRKGKFQADTLMARNSDFMKNA
jgi:hypothetical protein